MADVNGVVEVEVLDDRSRVGGVVIHVVAVRHLARASVAAPVDPDDPIAVLDEEQHLRVPVVGREGPAVMEDDGLTVTPILVEDLDTIFGRDCAHGISSSSVVVGVESKSRP